MTGNVLLVHTESKKMIASLKAVGVSQIPLAERAGDLVGVAVAVTHTCDVDIGFCTRWKIRARDSRGNIESARDTQGSIQVTRRGRDVEALKLIWSRARVGTGAKITKPEFVALGCGKLRSASDGP